MGKLVALENIGKAYAAKTVIKGISLDIFENQSIAILGGDGTGKSTLLQIIAGLVRPSSGSVIYPKRNIKIGYVPERFPKLLRFTPSEYLYYKGNISGIPQDTCRKDLSKVQ